MYSLRNPFRFVKSLSLFAMLFLILGLSFSGVNAEDLDTSASEWTTVNVVENAPNSIRSMDMDSKGIPHISYWDISDLSLKYVTVDGGNWNTVIVDSQPVHEVGMYNSIGIDGNDHPHFSYKYADYSATSIKHAWFDGTAWAYEKVTDQNARMNHLVFSPGDPLNPIIAYRQHGPIPEPWVAEKEVGGWQVEQVESYQSFTLGGVNIAVSPMSPYAVYYVYTDTSGVKVAQKNSSGWVATLVVGGNFISTAPAIAVDGQGSPHLCFHTGADEVFHGFLSDGQWNVEKIADGRWCTLEISNSVVHTAYTNVSANTLEYAYLENGHWTIQSIDSIDGPGEIALDGSGRPNFLYFAEGAIRWAFQGSPPILNADLPEVGVLEGSTALNSGMLDSIFEGVSLSASIGSVVNHEDGTWSWRYDTHDGPAETQTVVITADGGFWGFGEVDFDLRVSNTAPTVHSVIGPIDPIPIGNPVSVEASFDDPAGIYDEPYSCTVNYGDDTGDLPGVTVGSLCYGPAHYYTQPGIYVPVVTVIDKDGGSGYLDVGDMIILYDPVGGFVTGGGWIESPVGAYKADPALTGKATFGFVSKYNKKTRLPEGNTQFVFNAAGLSFHSGDYDWLVVNKAESRAQFKGTGTVNGYGAFKFMLWATDGDQDTFRIMIWWEDGENEIVVYDNGIDQVLGSGSIIVHAK